MKKFLSILLFLLFMVSTLQVQAQELALVIQGQPPRLTVTPITDGELEFGRVVQNQGPVQISLFDGETEVLQIDRRFSGFFDWLFNGQVRISVTSNNNLTNGSSTIPFTLRTAVDREGETENKNQAETFSNNTQFQMPGYWQEPPGNVSTAYLYIYGDITVNNVEAGNYSGTINVDVNYGN